EKQRAARLTKRQYVRFAFYTIDPEWRRLRPDIQEHQKRKLLDVITSFNRRMLLRPYSTMGTRADTELLLWQIAEKPEVFQELAAAIMRTEMGAYLNLAYSYFSQTKRSLYEIRTPAPDGEEEDEDERLVIDPSESKWLFVYPFIKTREWYQLSQPARQGMMDEHITVGRKYPSIRLNTTYSFGIDDYEFIVAFETDEPSDFLDLVQELRESTVSMYTLQDTPLFTCMNMRLDAALDALGGPEIAEKIEAGSEKQVWMDVCPLDDLAPGETKVVYLEGKQVGIFNINGNIHAINNRCSHARGPLTEGEVDAETCSVVCPWHYGKFDIATGQPVDGIVNKPVETYDVEIRDGVIWVGTKMVAR
ncbi:MAG: chlorite dismutase family protein, partial [Chloroflexota bacterium]